MTKRILAVSVAILPTKCELCPRRCGANRAAGERGVCGAARELRIARAALHEWEEPPISVGAGSGAVFFSHCPLRCVFCQNVEIACGNHGTDVSVDRLARIFVELREQGAANINLVTPSHYFPFIRQAQQLLADMEDALLEQRVQAGALSEFERKRVAKRHFELPFICNTSGYENASTIREYSDCIDVYLTDFRYWRDGESNAARTYSHAPEYFDVASQALAAMAQAAGEPVFGPFGGEERLERGVVIRHLLMPGRLQESKRIIDYLWHEYGSSVLYSIMNQYTPMRDFPNLPELNHAVPEQEYDQLLDFADGLGMVDYFWQEGGAATESFIPAFDNTGVV